MNRKALTDRWKSETGRALADEVIARLAGGRGLNGLGLGCHEGRLDLRCLPVALPRRLQRSQTQGWFVEKLGDLVEFKRARLENLDLSGAQLVSFRLIDTQVAGCRFDGANCRDWRLWGCAVNDCSFIEADLREAAVGTWHQRRRNIWCHVDFTQADLRDAVVWAAEFADCCFQDAMLDKVEFEQCALSRCRFGGELREVVFDGRDLGDRPAPSPMQKVDFSEATFRQVEFKGFDLEDVSLPKDPDIRLVRRARCVARRGLEMLCADDSVEARMLRGVLENRLRGPGHENEAEVFNRRDYLEIGGPPFLALAEDVFARAEAECLS